MKSVAGDAPRKAGKMGLDGSFQGEIAGLVARYDKPGPRYTSYPPVPHWQQTFSPEMHARQLQRVAAEAGRGQGAGLSLYVHLPFCESRCLYCGCNVVISKKREVVDPYLQTLEREIAAVSTQLGDAGEVGQLHLGGGTPTYLLPEQLATLVGSLAGAFGFEEQAELSVEVDPSVTSEAHLETLRHLGFSRISLGVQDVNTRVQAAINRVQPAAETARFVALCRSLGFSSINVDLIYGLPHQSRSSFARTVDTVMGWHPDRLALFSYAHIPSLKPHQKRLSEDAMPDPQEKLWIYIDAVERLTQAGFNRIGLDHFARPQDELSQAAAKRQLRRNFMGFTTLPDTNLVAFGMSGISELSNAYIQNASHLPDYKRAVEGTGLATARGFFLDDDDRLRRDVITQLLCNGAVEFSPLEVAHGIAFESYFDQELQALEEMERDGLVVVSPDRLEATTQGRWVLRALAMVFDRYLDGRKQDSRKGNSVPTRYSRTI